MKLIDADAAIEALNTQAEEMSHWSERYQEQRRGVLTAVNIVADCPSVQPNHCAEVGKKVLIDRQEALEAIGTLQTYKLFEGDDMILVDKAQVQTELMMLPSVQSETNCSEIPNNWIPCSERLPDNGRQVLVFARSVHFVLAKYDEMREADGTYKMQWVTFDAWKPFYKIKDVIAWMPLPEPYQEGEQE